MSKANAIIQNSPEWLEWRRNGIGASDLPVILGISPYCSAYNLWREKLGFAHQKEETPSQRRGKILEEVVRDRVNTSSSVCKFVPACVQHTEITWAIASLDGYDEKENIILEIKNTSKINHELAKQGSVANLYIPQVQWQLFVSGAKKCLYVHSYDNEDVIVEVDRDDAYIKDTLLPAAVHFYNCMINFEPPEITEKDHVFIDDEEFGTYAELWKEANKQRKLYEKKEKELREKLLTFTDDGNCSGYGITITRTKPRSVPDWEKLYNDIKIENPEIAEKFKPENYIKDSIGPWRIEAVK